MARVPTQRGGKVVPIGGRPACQSCPVRTIPLSLTLFFTMLGVAFANPLTSGDSAEIGPGETGAADSGCPRERPARAGGFSAQFGPDGGAELTAFKIRGAGWRALAVNTGAEVKGFGVETGPRCRVSVHVSRDL